MRRPTISICIPTFNGREHLAECLASVRAQTFQDFEVVLCDDLSADCTLALARELAAGDDRFRFIQNPRRFGLVGNWNNCVGVSRGEWIKFVFQDDIIRPDCCERLLAVCEQTGRRFGFCGREFLFEGTVAEKDRLWFLGHQKRLAENYYGKVRIDAAQSTAQLAADPFDNLIGEPTVTLIHRTLFGELGLFNEALIHLCDSEFWNRVLVKEGAAFEAANLAVFRIHSKAETARNHGTRGYRTNTLDPLIILHQLAFGSHYRPFRRLTGVGRNHLSLESRCAAAAYLAWKQAASCAETGGFDNRLRDEWKSVVAHYPSLIVLAWAGGALAGCQKIVRMMSRR